MRQKKLGEVRVRHTARAKVLGLRVTPHVDCMVLWRNLLLRAWAMDRLPLSSLLGFDMGDPRAMARIGVLMKDARN